MSGINGLDDSSEAHLTERRRAGMPPSTFRAVVAIVIVLLLINVYALTQLFSPNVPDDDENGDEPEPILHPWNVTVEAQVIDEDTTWTERSGPLEAPLVIADGATLRLEDCYIELLAEDFIFFRTPYITVERGGRLEIAGSTVELVYDPWLEHTLVGPFYSWRNYPYMSRVVNLTDTVDPVVSFDVKWKGEGTRLAVAVQLTPESGLVTLDTLEPTGSPADWFHFSVSLSDYIGMDVNVVLYTPDFPQDVLFIHDLMVTDGGVLLPHDLPLSEKGYMQYWLRDDFATFDGVFMWFGHYSQLIFAEGDILVEDSDLVSPDVRRRGDRNYMHLNVWGSWSFKNIRASTGDWNIWMDGANLTVRGDSTITNIPVECNNSVVSVDSTRIRSTYDMFTLFGSSGSFSNSTFISDGVSPFLRWWGWEARPLWAISVENNSAITPVDIIDCEFRGVGQAIDMGYAYVNVRGCEFQDITNLTVWNHHSQGIESWEDLEANNVFRDSTGFLYLQTRQTFVELNASAINSMSTNAYDTNGNRVDDYGVHPDLYRYLMDWDGLTGRLMNPQVLVESKDRIRYIDHVEIGVGAEIYGDSLWGYVVLNVSPYDEAVYLDAYPPLKEQEVDWWDEVSAPISLRAIYPTPQCETAGAYTLVSRIYTDQLYAMNVTIDFIINDILVKRYNEWDIGEMIGSTIELIENLTFGQGANRLSIVVSGQVIDESMNLTEEPLEIGNLTHHLLRVNSTTSPSIVREYLGNENAFLLMDPGVDVEIVGLEPWEIGEDEWMGKGIRVIGAENTSLTLTDTAFEGEANFRISYLAPVDIHVSGGTFQNLEITLERTYPDTIGEITMEIVNKINLDNLTVEYLTVVLMQGHLELSDISNSYGFYFHGYVNASVSIQNCDMNCAYSSIWGPFSSIVMEDCRFTDIDVDYSVFLYAAPEGIVRVSNCTFLGTSLAIFRENSLGSDWTVSVTDCEFIGEGAYLGIMWDQLNQRDWVYPPNALPVPMGTIEGNVFRGDGTGILLHHKLYGGFWGDNQLDEGTRLWAWYMTGTLAQCTDPTVGGKSEVIILEGPTAFDFSFGFDKWPFKNDVIIDVTDDPSSALDPPKQHAVITWGHNYGYPSTVMGYGEVDLSLDQNAFVHPYWPDLQTILPDYVEPWPIPMGFP